MNDSAVNSELLPVKTQPGVSDLASAAGFTDSAGGIERIKPNEAGAIAAVAREEGEIKAAIFLARANPRSESQAYTNLMRACERPGFAAKGLYRFPRGQTEVTGPTVGLAREMARLWGNIRYGCRVVASTDDEVHIKGYALDLETNSYVEAEDRFKKLIQRKQKGGGSTWIKPDERDLRELVNRRAAFLVRNCLLSLIPPDVKEDAEATIKKTMVAAAHGEVQNDRQGTIKKLLLTFDSIGISAAMLEDYLNHPMQAITPEEVADLRQVYVSIKDGQSQRGEYFNLAIGQPTPAPAPSTGAPTIGTGAAVVTGGKDLRAEAARQIKALNESVDADKKEPEPKADAPAEQKKPGRQRKAEQPPQPQPEPQPAQEEPAPTSDLPFDDLPIDAGGGPGTRPF